MQCRFEVCQLIDKAAFEKAVKETGVKATFIKTNSFCHSYLGQSDSAKSFLKLGTLIAYFTSEVTEKGVKF